MRQEFNAMSVMAEEGVSYGKELVLEILKMRQENGKPMSQYRLVFAVSLTALTCFTIPQFSFACTNCSANPYILSGSTNSKNGIDLRAIAQIESSGRPRAVGDGGRALGLFQLHKSVIADWNQAHPATRHEHKDALNPTVASKVASWYLNERIPALLRHFKKPVTTENILISYNCGIGCVVKGRVPKTTQNYLKKYKGLTHGA